MIGTLEIIQPIRAQCRGPVRSYHSCALVPPQTFEVIEIKSNCYVVQCETHFHYFFIPPDKKSRFYVFRTPLQILGDALDG